jgi:hypothetical protein
VVSVLDGGEPSGPEHTSTRRTQVRALTACIGIAGLIVFSLIGQAADEPNALPSRDRPSRAVDEDEALKPAGTSSKPSRAAEEETLKRAGTSKPNRAADEESIPKPTGASSRVGREAEDDTILKSVGASSRPDRTLDDGGPVRGVSGARSPVRATDGHRQ